MLYDTVGPALLATLRPDQFQAVAGHFADADPDRRFELLLDIFVDGLAGRAASAEPGLPGSG